MFRIALAIALAVVLASCAAEERDLSEISLSVSPTGSGFACVVTEGDAPDSWIVFGLVGEQRSPVEFEQVSDLRVEFEPFSADYSRVECFAIYPEGNRTVSVQLVR